jgi:hypothetical protein
MGYYDTLRANTTIDGKAGTFMTHSEMAVKLANQRASNLAAVETLFGTPRSTEVSPSAGSWTLAYGEGEPAPRTTLGANGPGTTNAPPFGNATPSSTDPESNSAFRRPYIDPHAAPYGYGHGAVCFQLDPRWRGRSSGSSVFGTSGDSGQDRRA